MPTLHSHPQPGGHTSALEYTRLTTPTPTLRTTSAAERYVLAAAGCVIVALTAAGFWLSYAHLAEVAGRHGLGNAPERQWAWPATLDAFIVAGELLMLRASLHRVTDWWAIALTVIGSLGSIALNVAGVHGTRGTTQVPLLDYVIAAVPPAAALLAFGALMRQIHQYVAERVTPRPSDDRFHSSAVSAQLPHDDGRAVGSQPEPTGEEPEDPGDTSDETVLESQLDDGPRKAAGTAVPSRKVGRPTTGDLDDFLVIVEKLEGEPTLKQMRKSIEGEGHSISNERLGNLKQALVERRRQTLTGTSPGR